MIIDYRLIIFWSMDYRYIKQTNYACTVLWSCGSSTVERRLKQPYFVDEYYSSTLVHSSRSSWTGVPGTMYWSTCTPTKGTVLEFDAASSPD